MGVKSVETLGSKIRFSSVLDTFSSLPPETMLIFLFPRLHRPQHLRNIELRGRAIRDLTLDAKSLRKSSFNTDDKERRDEDIETRTVIF